MYLVKNGTLGIKTAKAYPKKWGKLRTRLAYYGDSDTYIIGGIVGMIVPIPADILVGNPIPTLVLGAITFGVGGIGKLLGVSVRSLTWWYTDDDSSKIDIVLDLASTSRARLAASLKRLGKAHALSQSAMWAADEALEEVIANLAEADKLFEQFKRVSPGEDDTPRQLLRQSIADKYHDLIDKSEVLATEIRKSADVAEDLVIIAKTDTSWLAQLDTQESATLLQLVESREYMERLREAHIQLSGGAVKRVELEQ